MQHLQREPAGHDEHFVGFLDAFRPSGGLARAEHIVALARGRCQAPRAKLGRLIARRQALSFRWSEMFWLPLFQFDLRAVSIRMPVARVLVELPAQMDCLDRMQWFSTPNGALGDRLPADVIATDSDAVWQAARLQRFALHG